MAYGMALTHCAGLSGGLARATRCTLRQAVLTTRPVFTRQTKGALAYRGASTTADAWSEA